MPRSLTSAAAIAILTAQGTEPHLILSINYALGVTEWFATKDVVISGLDCLGSIISCSNIHTDVKKLASATTSTASIILSDPNQFIQEGMNAAIFEKTAAAIYLWYEGTSSGDMIILAAGNIVGPVSWDETSRTVTLNIESPLQNKDLGFAPTIQDFADLDPGAQGISWPMIFGKCAHVPAVKVHTRGQGALMYPIRFYNYPSYNFSNGYVTLKDNPSVYSLVNTSTGTIVQETKDAIFVDGFSNINVSAGSATTLIQIDRVIFQGTFNTSNPARFDVTKANLPLYQNVSFGARVTADKDALHYNIAWVPDDKTNIANCCVYLKNPVGNAVWFNYCVSQEGRKCWFRYPFYVRNSSNVSSSVYVTPSHEMTAVYPIEKNGMLEEWSGSGSVIDALQQNRPLSDPAYNNTSGTIAAIMDKMAQDNSSWWSAPADAIVTSHNITDSDVYVASLVQLASIQAVYGKRHYKDKAGKSKESFEIIPKTYYTTQLASTYTVVGQNASAIIINPPLSTYKDQDWEDGVWVTATSTIGPNPVDTIQFIANNFTTLNISSGSFAAARTNCRDANFTLFEKRSALTVIEEIAWQARLGVILESGVISLNFLPSQGSLFFSMDDDAIDIDGGYTQTQTPLQETVTKLLATWTDTYKERQEPLVKHNRKIHEIENIVRSLKPDRRRSRSETLYYMYQRNTKKLGVRTHSVPVYIFNEPSPVKECIDFWGFRLSEVWKKAKFKCFPGAIQIQPFDPVTIAMADSSLLNASFMTGLCIGTAFNYSDMSVIVEMIFPFAAGTGTDQTMDYWPGNTYTGGSEVRFGDMIWAVDSTS